MADKSKIEWTEASWNPIAGCTKCSPGCLNCYAERMANRQAYMGNVNYRRVVKYEEEELWGENVVNVPDFWFNGWNGKIVCIEKSLEIPLHWRKPRQIFVNSMSDTFHPSVPFEFIDKIMAVGALCPQHTLQILTKRDKRMLEYMKEVICKRRAICDSAHLMGNVETGLRALTRLSDCKYILPNLWLGVTVCNQKEKYKIDTLRQIPAAVRFISIEPCLADMGELDLTGIHWVILGGESGPGARPLHPDSVRSVRDQCAAADPPVPFFFKQWGEWLDFNHMDDSVAALDAFAQHDNHPDCFKSHTFDNETTVYRVGKKKAGHLLDGKEYREYPK